MCFYRKTGIVEVQGDASVAGERVALPQGTLDLLILRTLRLRPEHGWAIAERVQQISGEVLQIPQGSLYPALHRLERRGLIKSGWTTAEGRRRRVYRLTARGRRELEDKAREWRAFARVVDGVLP